MTTQQRANTILRIGARYGYLRSVLKSSSHRLRAMEPRDVSQLHAWENASEDWWMGASVQPISMEAMQQFATGQHDLYRDRQLRWMLDALLSEGEWNTVGAVDLYDFDPRQRRAGVAIHVDQNHRRLGHALGGLLLLERYAQQHLDLVQLYAEVPATHLASQGLFKRAGFVATGTRNMWVRKPDGTWDDVVTMQLVFDHDAEPPRPSP